MTGNGNGTASAAMTGTGTESAAMTGTGIGIGSAIMTGTGVGSAAMTGTGIGSAVMTGIAIAIAIAAGRIMDVRATNGTADHGHDRERHEGSRTTSERPTQRPDPSEARTLAPSNQHCQPRPNKAAELCTVQQRKND